MQLEHLLLPLGALCLGAPASSAQTFDLLGVGRALGVTPDGGTVLGGLEDATQPDEVWLWADFGGGTLLPLGGSQPRALSADSGTVLGGSTASGFQSAELWSSINGWSALGGFGPDCNLKQSTPADLSGDGKTAVGRGYDGCSGKNFKWTQAAGMVALPQIGNISGVLAVSSDGTTIGGWDDGGGFSQQKASVWFPDGSQQLILNGIAPNGGGHGMVHGFSSDGSIAVGGAQAISGLGGFKWDAVNGPLYLGELPGFSGARAVCVSDDGKTIAGYSSDFFGPAAGWLWTEADGLRSIDELLAAWGMPLAPGQTVLTVADMTPDGRVLVGAIDNGPGLAESGFRLTLPDACGFTAFGVGASASNVLSLAGTGSTDVGATPILVTDNVSSPNAVVALSLAAGNLPLAGGVLLLDTTQLVATLTVPAVGGTASLPLPLPNDPNLGGASLFLQSLSFDPTQPGWLAFSNGLELTICP